MSKLRALQFVGLCVLLLIGLFLCVDMALLSEWISSKLNIRKFFCGNCLSDSERDSHTVIPFLHPSRDSNAQSQITYLSNDWRCKSGQLFELSNVRFNRGVIELYRPQIHTLPTNSNPNQSYSEFVTNYLESFPKYTRWDGNQYQTLKFEFRVMDEHFNQSFCNQTIEEFTYLQYQQYSHDNAFHTHNDHMWPFFGNIILQNRLSQLNDIRLIVVDENHDKINPAWGILQRSLKSVSFVFNFSWENDICFQHLGWGQGMRPLYGEGWGLWSRQTHDHWRQLAFNAFDLPLPPSLIQSPSNSNSTSPSPQPKVLFILRAHDDRNVDSNGYEVMYQYFEAFGFEIVKCCTPEEWHAFTPVLRMFGEASIAIGVHGAGLIHFEYLPPGALAVELKTHRAFDSQYFATLTTQSEIDYTTIDFRPFLGEGRLSNETAALTVEFLIDVFYNRKSDKYKDISKYVWSMEHVEKFIAKQN